MVLCPYNRCLKQLYFSINFIEHHSRFILAIARYDEIHFQQWSAMPPTSTKRTTTSLLKPLLAINKHNMLRWNSESLLVTCTKMWLRSIVKMCCICNDMPVIYHVRGNIKHRSIIHGAEERMQFISLIPILCASRWCLVLYSHSDL